MNIIFLNFMKNFVFLISILFYQISYADVDGLIIKVVDGDTVQIKNTDNEILRIRLKHIDAPELDQEFGNESKLILQRFILNKKVKIIGNKRDRYKRLLGIVILDEVDINLEMIKVGAAWHFKKYAEFDQTKNQYLIYDKNEYQAKLKKIGLWKENPISPWQWRKNKK